MRNTYFHFKAWRLHNHFPSTCSDVVWDPSGRRASSRHVNILLCYEKLSSDTTRCGQKILIIKKIRPYHKKITRNATIRWIQGSKLLTNTRIWRLHISYLRRAKQRLKLERFSFCIICTHNQERWAAQHPRFYPYHSPHTFTTTNLSCLKWRPWV